MDFLSQMARLRVASETGVLPADLGRWVIAEFMQRCPRGEVVRIRNELIRQAAIRIEGNRKEKAIQIRAEMLALYRRRGPLTTVQALLRSAIEIDSRCPDSVRHILRIISAGDNFDPTLSPDSMAD